MADVPGLAFLALLLVALGYAIRYRWYSPYGRIVPSGSGILEEHYQKADVTGNYLPALGEVDEMESRLDIHMSKMYCQGQKYKFGDYHYQYVGIVYKGRKKIYVMAFPNEDIKSWWDWHAKTIIRTFDGGPKIFNTEYDTASGTFTRTWFNGPLMIDGGDCGPLDPQGTSASSSSEMESRR